MPHTIPSQMFNRKQHKAMRKKWKDRFLHARKYARVMNFMKICVFVLSTGTFLSLGQRAAAQTLSLEIENQSLRQVLPKIEWESEVGVL